MRVKTSFLLPVWWENHIAEMIYLKSLSKYCSIQSSRSKIQKIVVTRTVRSLRKFYRNLCQYLLRFFLVYASLTCEPKAFCPYRRFPGRVKIFLRNRTWTTLFMKSLLYESDSRVKRHSTYLSGSLHNYLWPRVTSSSIYVRLNCPINFAHFLICNR